MSRSRGRRQHLSIVNPNAAGIDVGSAEHWVAVPPDRDPKPVRRFGAFTEDLEAIAEWLKRSGVDTVAMEATGVYWISLFQVLETRGFKVMVVNARHLRRVSGRKTDFNDCQWIQELHTLGLLNASFRPENDVCALRSLVRHRENLVHSAAQQVQLMQKSLIQMNLLLQKVVTDITGVTGRKIIDDILAGQRDPKLLAQHRNPHIKASEEDIARHLKGDYREEHLFTLRQAVDAYDFFMRQLDDCHQSALRILGRFKTKLPPQALALDSPAPTRRKRSKNAPPKEFHDLLFQCAGSDLTKVPGIEVSTALTVVSEIGLDMSRFPNEKRFASWIGLAPSPKVSGGKTIGHDRPNIRNRAAQALRMAASTLRKSPTALGAQFRRFNARLGPAKTIKAMAHKLAKIVYRLLKYGTAYVDAGEQAYQEQFRARRIRALKRNAADLGLALVPMPAGEPVS